MDTPKDEYLYQVETLIFLKSLLDDFTINLLKGIIKFNKNNNRGLILRRLDDYDNQRRKYDCAVAALSAQGLIQRSHDATMKPISVTERGLQMAQLLLEEKRQQSGGITN